MKPAILNSLLIAGAVLCGLVLTELVYEQFEPEDQRDLSPVKSQYHYFQYDSKLGWVNKPGSHGMLTRGEFKTHVAINEDGMRYHEVPSKKRYRVAVLGDSFAWGFGVEEEERFTDLIEKQLGVDMLNFSVSAYGPTQYYLQLDKVLKYKPDLVVMAFCLCNDFADTVTNRELGHYKPYAALENGKLAIKGIPVPDSKRFPDDLRPWLTHFALGRLLYLSLDMESEVPEVDVPKSDAMRFKPSLIYTQPQSPRVEMVSNILSVLFKATQEKLALQHVPLLIVAIPGTEDLENPNGLLLLQDITRPLHIPVQADLSKNLTQQDYFTRDPHWNKEGHRKAAAMLLPVIKSYKEKISDDSP